MKEFAHLFEKKDHITPIKLGVDVFKGYIKIASTLTNFRESILRYAAFLSYVHLIEDNDGVAPFLGMSKKKEVEAINRDIYDMAFKLANETLGAYDQVSQNTQWLRDNSFLSFISWVEVNFKRHVQMYKNIWSGNHYLEYWIRKYGADFINKFIQAGGGNNGGGGNNNNNNNGGGFNDDDTDPEGFKKLFKALGKSPAYILRFAITLAMSMPLMIILSIFNKLNGENDEKLTPDVRNSPHLTLNVNERTGEVLYLSRIGSAVDFFETLGFDSITRDVKDIFDGRLTFSELPGKIVSGVTNKLINNANPFAKALVEMTTGRRLYPSFKNPTPIRDNWEYLAQSFAMDWYYKALTDKPRENFSEFSKSIASSQNPEQAAYWFITARKREFQEQVLGIHHDGYTQTKKGEALYNARVAAGFKDWKLMRKYLIEFYKAGGTDEGLKSYVKSIDPLNGLDDDERIRFMMWLPKQERHLMTKALRFSEKLKDRLDY